MESHGKVIDRLRTAFRSRVTVPLEFRLSQLRSLLSLMEENEAQILEALHKDLAKPKFEAVLSEIEMVVNDICYAIDNLKYWVQPDYVGKNLATKLDDCFVHREPLGVVLIIGAWNYPLQLVLLPLVGAIAAGNCAVLKPSEISQATEALLAELIPKYLSQECFSVVCGGAEATARLLENRFDHIFYTGSQAVARSVLQAAAVHLTPVTLELGGKCPCLLYGQLDIPAAAKRLAWAKYFNAGQSCVAPDYVLCSRQVRDVLLPALQQALHHFYGPQPQRSVDMGRIVTERHWSRLMDLLGRSGGRVAIGGESSREERYIAPTVVVDVQESDALMQEEIFGPILPILTIESLEEGIELINRREKPLALYVFSDESKAVSTVLEKTSSGGFCSNDGIVHMTLPGLPFGGVGASGMGSYHGRWSFETFSHRRGCMLRGWGLEKINVLRYPPYRDGSLSWLRWATTTKKKGWSSCSVM
ncbi:aldehyde dehydrogenase family 3 member B1 [Denticeps clupeoides]|uniref:aldehyde dehydrogenase family 3 member B1 n=1 Tax=Denticeps clupeoides TaxID=299321 RepID=UPI0010A35974|nr:aldehyde dehydrogenase family 3 member B1-like [Denticeps clupeoides]XP_028842622.1 aldehyde dehydrogenase family 3 member B1-like [Denticeps clupeoides]